VWFYSQAVASPILIPTSPLSNYPVASIVSPVLGHSQPTDSLQSNEQYVTGVSKCITPCTESSRHSNGYVVYKFHMYKTEVSSVGCRDDGCALLPVGVQWSAAVPEVRAS